MKVTSSYVAEAEADLDVITDVIHDCWFDLETITFDESNSLLEIPFQRERPELGELSQKRRLVPRLRIPVTKALLRIYAVEKYDVKDTARVGKYDFNRLLYSADNHTIQILTGVPLEFVIRISRLRVEVVQTDTVVEYVERAKLF